MPVPKPENVGDIYLVRDYPAYGQSCYGMAYPDDESAEWVIQLQDGDSFLWDEERARWDIVMDSEQILSEQILVRRNEWPKETP